MDAPTIRLGHAGPGRNVVKRGSGTDVSASATILGAVHSGAKCILCGSGDSEVFCHL